LAGVSGALTAMDSLYYMANPAKFTLIGGSGLRFFGHSTSLEYLLCQLARAFRGHAKEEEEKKKHTTQTQVVALTIHINTHL
jgi:hypothetical protein